MENSYERTENITLLEVLNPSKCRIELNNISAGEQLKIACRKDNILTEGHNVIDISMETLIFL